MGKQVFTFLSCLAAALGITLIAGLAFAAGDPAKGALIFKSKCQACHGTAGEAGVKGGMKTAANFANLDANIPRIKDLLANLSEEDHKKIVREGGAKSGVKGAAAAMPKIPMPATEIEHVVAYERSLGAFKKANTMKK